MRLAWLAAILLSTSAAHAFVPDGDGALISASGAPPRLVRATEPARIAGWDARRDRDTGAVTQLSGSYVTVPGAMRDPQLAERAARAFLAQHVVPAGTRIDDFVLVENRIDDGKRTVSFVQTWNGLRVVGGQMHVVFANDRLFSAGSEALPNVRAQLSLSRASTARAAAWVQTPLRATGQRVILPIIRGPNDIEYRAVDVLDAPAKQWDVYVAADGTPIARRSRVQYATSTMLYDVGERYASGTRIQAPAPRAQLTVDGAGTTTATDGGFAWGSAVAASVTPSLTGAVVHVSNQAGADATTTLTAQPGQPVVWSLASDELGDAQLSAYVYVNQAKAAGKRINPGLAWLDQVIDVQVNIDDTCNAFSTGDSIHFYKASADCQNTARLADVVHHEFGHSFHNQSAIAGAGGFDFSINEGIADFYAANMSGDSGVGRGFHYNDNAVRELDPVGVERVSPRDITLVSHVTGLIIAGALWDLRKQLIAKHGSTAGIAAAEKIFLGIVQRAADLTKTYNAALVADDDDGDLGNGTPNGCIIESAFGRHGLAGDSFRETTLATPVIDGSHVSVTVQTPSGTACPPAQVTGVTLKWRVGGGALAAIPMTAQGATWSADLPAQPAGTVVEFQVVATLDTSETLLLPDNVADPLYQVFTGSGTEIFCERFDADPRWKQDGAVEWDVAAANPANAAAGDPASAFAGSTWLGTDLRGDGRYRSDILTSIETPQFDATAFEHVHLQFRRWLVIEDAALDVATIRINGMQIWSNATNESRTLDHLDKEWRFVDLDISAQASIAPATVAFTLASDPLRELGGWNIDELCVIGVDKKPLCGDHVVDLGEECDEISDDCDRCMLVSNDGGCCSTSGDGLASMLAGLGLLQFTILVRRRASRRRPSRSVSERMP